MSEAAGGNQAQRAGIAVGALAAFLVLYRLGRRRRKKKLLKAQARARAHLVEQRMREEKARGKAAKRGGRKERRAKKDRSIPEQLVRFTILAVMKKLISRQIEQAGLELGSSKFGRKLASAADA